MPDSAPTPARLIATHNTGAAVREQHRFRIRYNKLSERHCVGQRSTSPVATFGWRRPLLGQGEVRSAPLTFFSSGMKPGSQPPRFGGMP
jgi:hypothetical protein